MFIMLFLISLPESSLKVCAFSDDKNFHGCEFGYELVNIVSWKGTIAVRYRRVGIDTPWSRQEAVSHSLHFEAFGI
jgi:hypothetical protein